MNVTQSIEVTAAPDRVYAVAHDVPNWGVLLPHYRYVRVLERDGNDCVCMMAARRDWFVVRWTAAVHLLPEIPRIEFTHVDGPTTGMRVAWIFDATPHGTRLTITHELSDVKPPLVRTWLGQQIAAKFFIEPIARRTLACMKAFAEDRNGQ
jgi:ribosome-associated toxin RatA of RatAB toxin-antitoxin module